MPNYTGTGLKIQVWWSDENNFNIFGQIVRAVYKESQVRDTAVNVVQPTLKHCGFHEIMNTEKYHQNFIHQAIPSGSHIIHDSFIFLDDNDPKHSTSAVKTYLKEAHIQRRSLNVFWETEGLFLMTS